MTIEQGMLLSGALCMIPALWYWRVSKRVVEFALHLSVPALVANAVYWGPFPDNWRSEEYRAWAGLFIVPFIASGIVGSALGGVIGRLANKKVKRTANKASELTLREVQRRRWPMKLCCQFCIVVMLAVLPVGCDTSKTTVLVGDIPSGISPAEVRRTLNVSSDNWKVIEDSHLPAGDKRPRFDILQVEIADFSDCGVKGILGLHFFNDRLTGTSFYPSDLAGYLRLLESRGIHFAPKKTLSKMERALGAARHPEVRVSGHTRVWLFRDYKGRDYVGWEDMKLSAERDSWIRSYS